MLVHETAAVFMLASPLSNKLLKLIDKPKLADFLQCMLQLNPTAHPITGHAVGAQPES
tara:strand:- start:23 stop:196 length:174 start_codon:yes stop_codon:yes gene_type:complete